MRLTTLRAGPNFTSKKHHAYIPPRVQQHHTSPRFPGNISSIRPGIDYPRSSPPPPGRTRRRPRCKKDAKDDPDAWFGQLKGKHRMILDVPRPHEVFPFVWPRVFLLTNT